MYVLLIMVIFQPAMLVYQRVYISILTYDIYKYRLWKAYNDIFAYDILYDDIFT